MFGHEIFIYGPVLPTEKIVVTSLPFKLLFVPAIFFTMFSFKGTMFNISFNYSETR